MAAVAAAARLERGLPQCDVILAQERAIWDAARVCRGAAQEPPTPLPREPPVELHILLPLDLPGEISRHPVPHELRPALAVLVGEKSVAERPGETGRVEGVEEEAGALVGPGVPGVDGV